MRLVFLFASVLFFSLRAEATQGLQVAEYRADVDDVAWTVGVETGRLRSGDGITEPWGLTEEESKSFLEKGFRIGSYRLSAIFDLYRSHDTIAAEPYKTESQVSLGPKLYFSPDSFAQLFYSFARDDVNDGVNSSRWGGDSIAQRSGLSQTWYLARRRAQITLGYGFEQSETEDLYDDLRAHSVIFSSRFPLFWGLSARIYADYAQNSYDNYLGAGDVGSDRKLFLASIDQSLGRGLLGELRFSYMDEDFDDAELSYRRYVWGLNLKYSY